MAQYGELYTVYEWHIVDPSGRVVVYMQNGGGYHERSLYDITDAFYKTLPK